MKAAREDKNACITYLVAALIIAALTLSGCATTGGWLNDSNTNARILTKGIVAEYLARNKGSVDVVYKTSADALNYVKTGNVSIDQLQAYVMGEIAPSLAKLTPEGQAAVAIFVDELKAQLVKQLPANGVDPSKATLEMVTFLTWINDVSRTYFILRKTQK